MPNQLQPKIETIRWDQIRPRVAVINPKLAAVIDEYANTKLPLIRLRYAYGESILEQGKMQLPAGLRELERASLLKQLSYSSLPLGLILNKGTEIFIKDQDSSIPLNVLAPGHMFGLFEVLDSIHAPTKLHSAPLWWMTAGARSACFLPRISDRNAHKHVARHFPTTDTPPKNHLSHWQVFKTISQHPDIQKDWYCEVLLFTDSWFKDTHSPFINYLYQYGWQQTQYARDRLKFDLVWKALSKEIARRNFKPNLYLSDTVKHILAASSGNTPCLTIAKDDELLPKQWLQKIYVEYYQLRDYLPTLIVPDFLKPKSKIYYSLALPLILAGSLEKKVNMPTVKLLYDMKRLFDLLKSADYQDLTPSVHFECYSNEESSWNILHSHALPLSDPNYLLDQQTYPDRVFCVNSPFMVGCIQISHI